jgi:tRNA-binding EMAP/Myf-like protein
MGATFFPYNFANRAGIPLIESNSVEVTTTNVVVNINNRAFRFLNSKGIIIFRLNTEIPAEGAALPVVFSSNNVQQTLTVVGGTNATGATLSGTGIYLIYYDKSSNVLQLLTTGA